MTMVPGVEIEGMICWGPEASTLARYGDVVHGSEADHAAHLAEGKPKSSAGAAAVELELCQGCSAWLRPCLAGQMLLPCLRVRKGRGIDACRFLVHKCFCLRLASAHGPQSCAEMGRRCANPPAGLIKTQKGS
jgi:hypothetical protein